MPLGRAKFHVNLCNESPTWGKNADFRPVSKFNTGSLPLSGNLASKNSMTDTTGQRYTASHAEQTYDFCRPILPTNKKSPNKKSANFYIHKIDFYHSTFVSMCSRIRLIKQFPLPHLYFNNYLWPDPIKCSAYCTN